LPFTILFLPFNPTYSPVITIISIMIVMMMMNGDEHDDVDDIFCNLITD